MRDVSWDRENAGKQFAGTSFGQVIAGLVVAAAIAFFAVTEVMVPQLSLFAPVEAAVNAESPAATMAVETEMLPAKEEFDDFMAAMDKELAEPWLPAETEEPAEPDTETSAAVVNPPARKSGEIPLSDLFYLVAEVETELDPDAVGDNGQAVGVAQIWKAVVDDANRICGQRRYSYGDRRDQVKSREIFMIYLDHYSRDYQKRTGQPPSAEICARIWNGGPYKDTANWWGKTNRYWRKVSNVLREVMPERAV